MRAMSVSRFCLLVAVLSSLLTAFSLQQLSIRRGSLSTIAAVVWTGVALTSLLMCAVAVDMYNLDIAASHRWATAWAQYRQLRRFTWRGFVSSIHFMWVSRDCRKLQEKVLLGIMRINSGCEYGRKYNFQLASSREDFVEKVPLSTYDNFKEYIERMVQDGEENLVSPYKTISFALTSGTSGKCKTFPLSLEVFNSYIRDYTLMFHTIRRFHSLRRIANLGVSQVRTTSPSGKPMSSASGLGFVHLDYFLSPAVAYKIPHVRRSLYVHALFALREREIAYIDAYMAPLCYAFFGIIENEGEQLCRDVANGFLGDDIMVDDVTRNEINRHLFPDPQRADEIRGILAAGNIALARRLWPSLGYTIVISSGAGFAHYAHMLDTTYLKDTPHFSHCHGGSEGMCGIMFNTEGQLRQNCYALVTRLNFFEFISEEQMDEDHPETLFVDQLETGQSYEIVLTNTFGPYRYRLGDVIKVIGYINECPLYEFMYRRGQELSVSVEKTSEQVIYHALMEAEKCWQNIKLLNYTTTESVVLQDLFGRTVQRPMGIGHYYVFFVEVEGPDNCGRLTAQQMEQVDTCLRDVFTVYENVRRKEAVDPVEVIQVKPGTFEGLKQLMTKDTRNLQFKMPRVIRRKELLQFLLDSISDVSRWPNEAQTAV